MGYWCIKVHEGEVKVFKDGSPIAKTDGSKYGSVERRSYQFNDESKKDYVKVRLSFTCSLETRFYNSER